MTDDAVWCFPVCLEGTGTILRLRWTLGMVLSNPFRWFFPQTQMISSHLCANQYLAQFLERFSTDLWSSLSVKVSLLVFCCIHSSCFGLSRLSVFSTQGVSWLPPLDSLSLGCSLEILSRQYTGTNVDLFLICFLSLKDHCSSLPAVQCHENHCYILFVFLVVSGRRVNLVFLTSNTLIITGG